jgi:hypothetical protein
MERKKDAVLRRLLKSWVNRQGLPDDGRARLLAKAARTSRNKTDLNTLRYRPQINLHPTSSSSDWTQTLFAWVDVNTIQFRFQVHLI